MINFLLVKDALFVEGDLMKIEVLGTEKALFQAALEALRLSGKKGRVVFVNDIKKMNLPRNCGQSEKLLQQSKEDSHGVEEKTF